MDALNLIVTALVAGLTTGLTDSTAKGINDAYAALKQRLWKKTGGNGSLQSALVELEKHPKSNETQEAVKEELAGSKIEGDTSLLALAKELMAKVDSLGTQQGKYNITLHNAQGVIIGDNPQVVQTFDKPTSEE